MKQNKYYIFWEIIADFLTEKNPRVKKTNFSFISTASYVATEFFRSPAKTINILIQKKETGEIQQRTE